MEGYEHKAFFTREKEINRIPKEPIKAVKELPKAFAERLSAELERKKAKKQEDLKNKELAEENKKPKGLGHASSGSIRNVEKPVQKMEKKKSHEDESKKKLTWKGLGNISYKDITGNEDFDPANLLVDQEDDDDYTNILNKFGKTPLPAEKKETEVHPKKVINTYKSIVNFFIRKKGLPPYVHEKSKGKGCYSKPVEATEGYLENLIKAGLIFLLLHFI